MGGDQYDSNGRFRRDTARETYFYTIAGAARELGVTPHKLRNLMLGGELPYEVVTVGGVREFWIWATTIEAYRIGGATGWRWFFPGLSNPIDCKVRS